MHADIAVYGSTVCSVTAAISAAISTAVSPRVVIIANSTNLGGMTSSGLGGRDSRMQFGGLAAAVWAPLGANFVPHAAEAHLVSMLATRAPDVVIHRNSGWIVAVNTTTALPRTIRSITLQSGLVVTAAQFVDCSYEGDLLRLSGTSFAVGRESRAEYNESLAGVDGMTHPYRIDQRSDSFAQGISPWVEPTNKTLLPGIVEVQPYSDHDRGEADDWVMSYCFRMCMTALANNSVPLTRPPEGYTNLTMELLRRQIKAVSSQGVVLDMKTQFLIRDLPEGKIDLNSGAFDESPFSTDLPFAQKRWPLGNASIRAEIFDEHVFWTRALLWFYAKDATVLALQPKLAEEVGAFGLLPIHFTRILLTFGLAPPHYYNF